MTYLRLTPDDPRLTAFALGELAGEERAAVEAAVQRDPSLQRIVGEIRTTAAHIEAALAAEAPPQFSRRFVPVRNRTPVRRRAGAPAMAGGDGAELGGHARGPTEKPSGHRSKWLAFPRSQVPVAFAAAACVAAMIFLRDDPALAERSSQREAGQRIASGSDTPPASVPPARSVGESVSSELRGSTQETRGGGWSTGEADTVAHESYRPVFTEGDLSLLGQTGWHREPGGGILPRSTAMADSMSTAPDLRGEPAAGTDVASDPGLRPSLELRPLRIESVATPVPGGSMAPQLAEALRPPVAGPVVAGPTPPSVLPPGTGGVVSSVVGAGPGDIVLLSPVTVTGERVQGFALSGTGRRAGSDTRRTALNDDRPFAPPGARFTRNADEFTGLRDNDFAAAAANPRSAFPFDVESGSYPYIRRSVFEGVRPRRERVRVEELLNYFPYRHAPPAGENLIGATLEVAEAPWAPEHRLVRIALKAREAAKEARPPANLVFLLDVSGSMNQPNKLPLLQQAMRALLPQLSRSDRLAVVVYGSDAGLVLPSTSASQLQAIVNAIDLLKPVGAAGHTAGIDLAYKIAAENFIPGGVNRVVLCTDGDFHVGASTEGDLVRLVEGKAASGVRLTALGLGMGAYRDPTLEKLAAKGQGVFGYIDTVREAEKVLIEQVGGTLPTLARDVRVEVEFNPAAVSAYRLIGYENPPLQKDDFNVKSPDAGEIVAGQSVTAVYEVVPSRRWDEAAAGAGGPTLLTVRVRYRKPDGFLSFSRTLEFQLRDARVPFAKASADFRFAAAVAQYGMLLRESPHRGRATLEEVRDWAAGAAAADDPGGYRAAFVELVDRTQALME